MYPIHGVQQAIMRAINHNNLKYTHVNTSTQVPRCYVVNGVDSFAIWVINDPSHKRTFLGPFCNKQDHRHPRNTPRLPLVELLYSDTGLLQSAGHEKCSYWLALPRRGWQALIGREQRHITLPKTRQPRKEDAPRWKAKGVQLLHLQLPTEQEEPLNCMVLTGSLLSQDTLRERVTSTEAVNIINAP